MPLLRICFLNFLITWDKYRNNANLKRWWNKILFFVDVRTKRWHQSPILGIGTDPAFREDLAFLNHLEQLISLCLEYERSKCVDHWLAEGHVPVSHHVRASFFPSLLDSTLEFFKFCLFIEKKR